MEKKRRRFIQRTIILFVLAMAIIYTVYTNLMKDERKIAQVGETAPDFMLEDMDGNMIRLSDYRGKGVFLNFWGTFCKPCEEEMPYIDRQYQIYKDQGVEVIAVNVGETDLAIETFAKRLSLSIPIVVDRKGEVQEAYGIFPLPATFLIDSNGKIIHYFDREMDEQTVKDFMERIKP
ncbi:thiol-disulfide oxidoreductase ResA [Fervidibacillus halotolerans]|uniref:Thiol-disulfide oxidoreductase ResA n=1 Tax=Fervidibacillus halotolerans TaxID=2980027 RepID=A0A9E8RZD2_9BACI|nr:thiol-disulfide oxidoreductase ResA [Fervidibacillus halotolerans]WAA13801.1 thiol-disulfide oxidoreductase ResA [Fervidibacillus halotolerans]